MLTREQILEIEQYCQDHKVSRAARLAELKICREQFFRWKKKYREADDAGQTPDDGAFLQITPGGTFVSPMMPPAKTSGKKSSEGASESFLTIELRTASGFAMRIQGGMTPAHLKELIAASHV